MKKTNETDETDGYEKLSFEEAMTELEATVAMLDTGDGTLDEYITLYQKGVQLSKLCSERLEEIEKRVRILTEDVNGDKKEMDFIGENSASGEKE